MKTILESIELTKIFKTGKIEVAAVRDVSLKVREGEFIAIMGPSGCGKSTLLHLLGGLATPTSGRVLVDGEEISSGKDAIRTDIRRRKIGFVFQRFNLLPTLSAQGNLEIAQEIHRNGSRDPQHVDEILNLLGLEKKTHHKPSELSGGEQQRLAIARAVINRPAILLADEPTGNLDTRNSMVVLKMIQELNRALSQTILMITHNPEAAGIASRLIEMRDGRIVSQQQEGEWNATEDRMSL
ncbi:MAG: ABC transporter ATP-binding protein [Acidobacteria bacterium]|jgi:putative ABC transport system ATP-binding protein|nr:ABC transporter ATP-binding protein [Acidobacteriota bacterium]MYC82171.1 ABC transporter ATP-binding protein [Acidobacteriota bacterium]